VKTIRSLVVSLLFLGVATAAWAQGPVRELQDLVGARGSSGEQALQQRGYDFARGEKSDNASITFWRHQQTQACIAVRTEEGRYVSITQALATDCSGDGAMATAGDQDDASGPNEFETVCGVVTGGKTYRYLCKATVHTEDGRRTRTIVEYPDITLTFNWRDDREVTVKTEGTADRRGTYSTSEGETDIVLEDMTYFFISNQEAARREVEAYRRQQR